MVQVLRVLIVGCNPSKLGSKKHTGTINRLNSWVERLGIGFYSFTNCVHVPGSYKKMDIDYDFLKECSIGYDRIIALGGFASSALSSAGIAHFKMSHPSGLNRQLNDRTYETRMLNDCSEYLYGR